jgi:hypothetical protein
VLAGASDGLGSDQASHVLRTSTYLPLSPKCRGCAARINSFRASRCLADGGGGTQTR